MMPDHATALAAYLRELAYAGASPTEETRLLLLDAACAIEAGRSEAREVGALVAAELVEPFASRVRECGVPARGLRVVEPDAPTMDFITALIRQGA